MARIVIHPEVINPVYRPFAKTQHDVEIYFGGSSSGKSFFLGQKFVLDVLAGRNILIVRKIANTLNKSTWNEINKAIIAMKLSKYFKINKSDYSITALNNNCQILFSGLDDVEKVKSITPINGVITDIWAEEATELDYKDYKQLKKRLRGKVKGKPNLKKRLTLSFNPIMKTHWIYKEFFSIWEDSKQHCVGDVNGESVSILKTTHLDNEHLTEQDHNALENEPDPYYREVYTYGNWGVLGDVIFRNWRTEDLTDLIPTFSNIRNGVDFGFSVDPFAYIRVHYDKMRKKIYVFKEIYELGCTNDMIADILRPIVRHERVMCDSAEPKSIQELTERRIKADGAIKGADSIWFGIQFLKQNEIIIDKSCQHFINEITTYQWQQDKNGNSIKRPIDKNNHLLDALRYALSEDMEFKKEKIGKINVRI